ncbi:hypothetical protein IEQ34_004757 [Dendrobium chrysotoxum]|uniref:Transposase n=1 Tax=Dendrobium chrysotoxum TaxID=161865 RepID=A0AAV7H172_DENCH|nr:hypothetical protein IEQ34_004757 [Dendrobium chrysotoxum]
MDDTRQDGDRRKSHGVVDDVASTITSDGLAVIRKKFHIINEVLIIAPKSSDRVHVPPPRFIDVYEMTLHAGLRFPPAPELLEIFKACGVSLPQFLYRAITIMVGLAVFFRERGVTLTMEYLSKMCKFTSDTHGRVFCQNNKKWLDFSTRDSSKNWSSLFFFVKNEWGLPEKWGRLKELPDSPNIRERKILKILKFSDTKSLQHELRYISGCVTEEYLFKVGLSIQAGRSHVIQLKKSKKTPEVESNTLKRSASHSSEGQKITDPSSLKKRKTNDKVIMPRDGGRCKEVARPLTTDTVSLDSDSEVRPSKIHIPEDVLKHICIGRHHAKEIMIQKMDMESKFESILDNWHDEFEREITTLDIEAISLKAVEEFKKSATYRQEIQRLTQEAYEKLFDVEVKDLERQSLKEGFTHGFLKGVQLVNRKIGADIEGLTPSKASEDSPIYSGDDGIESELKKVFFSDDDDVDIV